MFDFNLFDLFDPFKSMDGGDYNKYITTPDTEFLVQRDGVWTTYEVIHASSWNPYLVESA